MEVKEYKETLKKLIDEASAVAPSISRVRQGNGMYGTVTDENLDSDAMVTWEIEARAILTQLSQHSDFFKDIFEDYTKKKEASRRYHSRSILVHQIQQLLAGALALLDSPLLKSSPKSSRSGQYLATEPGYAFIAMPMDPEDNNLSPGGRFGTSHDAPHADVSGAVGAPEGHTVPGIRKRYC